MEELKKKLVICLAFARLKVLLILSISWQRKVAELKRHQKKEFEKIKNDFCTYYGKLKDINIDKYVSKLWSNYNYQLENKFLPYPDFNFLQDPIITRTMFLTRGGKWSKYELDFIEKKLNKDLLNKALSEDFIGGAWISNKKYLTSYNSIHHLYHFLKYFDETKIDIRNINAVVEWGGGYGNAAKIFKRLKQKPVTYILIDTPLFSCLQWIYLATIFGQNEVNLINSSENKIKKNKLNILPISLIDKYEIKGDLFISTWALSESSKHSQNYVVRKKWFSCLHLLLAFQSKNYWLPDAGRMKEIAKKSGCTVEKIPFLENNYYAFR